MRSFSVLLASVFTLGAAPNVIAAEIAGGNGSFETTTLPTSFINNGVALDCDALPKACVCHTPAMHCLPGLPESLAIFPGSGVSREIEQNLS